MHGYFTRTSKQFHIPNLIIIIIIIMIIIIIIII